MSGTQFEELLGRVISKIEIDEERERITFTMADGAIYRMDHAQDCCERVYLEDVVGSLADLLGSPLTEAECVSSNDDDDVDDPCYLPPGIGDESWTWTFYKLGTRKGSVTLRWFGASDGFYSERVDFYKAKE